ncbi:hypothetical protein PTI98_009286 [Pleurotus ostreatus]|nr:hypothetical protein PTI98_009286 [Pleurotus ostreatus]
MEHGPIFFSQRFAAPMARPADMNAEIDPEKAVSLTFVAQKSREEIDPLRCRTGTPMFVARSPVLGGLLLGSVNFRRMLALPCDVAAKYQTAHAGDSSGLRAFRDGDTTHHGGVYHRKDVERKYCGNSEQRRRDFRHQPRHDAESVFWCMVVFLLLAVPLGSPEEDPEESCLYAPWKLLASHRLFSIYEPADSRLHIIEADVPSWEAWLHPGLQHAARLMSLLAAQVSPEWGIIQPPPYMLHLHEAMQRIILTHIHVWDKENKDIRFDTERTRDTTDPNSWTYQERRTRQAAATLAPSKKSTNIDTSVLRKRPLPEEDDDDDEEEEEQEQPIAKIPSFRLI